MIGKTFIPASRADDWKQFLAEPEKQWREGYSARTTAEHWTASNGLPHDISEVFRAAGLGQPELLAAFPEWKTSLKDRGRESQSDVFALIRTELGLFTTTVEAKVNEPFGPLVSEWIASPTPGKQTRLAFLLELLGIDAGIADGLRYQLLHRTASALLEAEHFSTPNAAMIVQSFSAQKRWHDDFERFCEALALPAGSFGEIRSGRKLLLGWATPPSVT